MLKLLLISIVLSSCALLSGDNKSIKLTILHTNDHHGHFLKDSSGQIGMAARSTLLKKLRSDFKKSGTQSLLLSGGDINTGTMESDIFDAEPDFKGMNLLGYDAMAVGNHEFDNSLEVIQKQRKWAGFPFLSANIFYKNSKKRVFEPAYIIKEYQGIKVGIFGLTTIDTPFKASRQEARDILEFQNIIESAKEMVHELKSKEQVDLIIVVTHVGHKGSLTANGDVKLANAVDGIDVIVGGHSQEIINAENHNDTIIIQAEDWGRYLGKLDLKVSKKSVTQISYELIPINLKKKVKGKKVFQTSEIKQDPSFDRLFAPYKEKASKLGMRVIGSLDKTFSGARKLVRAKQMPVAQFMGNAIFEKIKNLDVAIVNGGSIRSELRAGDISIKNLHELHPHFQKLMLSLLRS